MDKLDKFTLKEVINSGIYKSISKKLNFEYNIASKMNNIENKKNIEFCNFIVELIKADLNGDKLISLDKTNCSNSNRNFINPTFLTPELSIHDEVISIFTKLYIDILKYPLIGFFFEKYEDKYSQFVSNLKELNDKLSDVNEEAQMSIMNEKNNLYKLLIIDFVMEFISTIVGETLNKVLLSYNIELDKVFTNHPYTNSLSQGYTDLIIIIGDNIEELDKHNISLNKIINNK